LQAVNAILEPEVFRFRLGKLSAKVRDLGLLGVEQAGAIVPVGSALG
jgi:hypothetical protein